MKSSVIYVLCYYELAFVTSVLFLFEQIILHSFLLLTNILVNNKKHFFKLIGFHIHKNLSDSNPCNPNASGWNTKYCLFSLIMYIQY